MKVNKYNIQITYFSCLTSDSSIQYEINYE